MQQGLHHDAILLRLLLQGQELFGVRVGSIDIELKANRLEANRDILGDAQRSLKVHVTAYRDFDVTGRNAHRSGHQLAGELRAGGEGANQKVAGAGGCAGSTDSPVGLGLINRAPNIDGAGQGCGVLTALRSDGDARACRFAAILLLEWLLY